MKTKENYIEILKAHIEEFVHKYELTSLVIFGSVSRNEQNENSDLDVFVSMPPRIFQVIAFQQELEELLGCKVDVVRDHRGLNPYLRKEIERDGINIFRAA